MMKLKEIQDTLEFLQDEKAVVEFIDEEGEPRVRVYVKPHGHVERSTLLRAATVMKKKLENKRKVVEELPEYA